MEPDVPRKTRKAWNERDHAHFLTFTFKNRLPVFTLPGCPEAFLSVLDRQRDELQFLIWAFVLMPDHVHLLIRPQATDYRMAEILYRIKSRSSRQIYRLHPHLREQTRVKRYGRNDEFHLWQEGGGFDRNEYSSKEVFEKIRYIHKNPVRAGLVEDYLDWKWSSAPAYLMKPCPIRVDICGN